MTTAAVPRRRLAAPVAYLALVAALVAGLVAGWAIGRAQGGPRLTEISGVVESLDNGGESICVKANNSRATCYANALDTQPPRAGQAVRALVGFFPTGLGDAAESERMIAWRPS